MREERDGFTLVELLVVIAILALLAAVLLPVLFKMQERARRVACQSNLHQIGIAFQCYRDEWDDGFVPGQHEEVMKRKDERATWAYSLLPYLHTREIYICPSNPDRTFSYGYNAWLAYLGADRTDVVDQMEFPPGYDRYNPVPSNTILAYDCPNGDPDIWGIVGEWDYGGFEIPYDTNQLFGDGDLVEAAIREKFRPANQPVPDWALPRHSDGNNVVFLDGHVRWYLNISEDMGLASS